ncbi:hypothetical protein NEIMUCOT_05202 [Neisseria mucosa ATCC 25996]|uniref:Uncharacterized protein n=1 Tax=Neisseria mucosa (strain ATCC 25996 / DSM 4631 / NCTC 10774 / M26) TaxID=546266 RepID=D2ZX53_NEIM2|nr:hypothetical protein NEIMUCOT_05202 [Neisseria mucosa ATCC 25996]
MAPRLFQKPNRVRITDSYLSLKRQACGLLTLSLALSHEERESGCQTLTFSGLPDI